MDLEGHFNSEPMKGIILETEIGLCFHNTHQILGATKQSLVLITNKNSLLDGLLILKKKRTTNEQNSFIGKQSCQTKLFPLNTHTHTNTRWGAFLD